MHTIRMALAPIDAEVGPPSYDFQRRHGLKAQAMYARMVRRERDAAHRALRSMIERGELAPMVDPDTFEVLSNPPLAHRRRHWARSVMDALGMTQDGPCWCPQCNRPTAAAQARYVEEVHAQHFQEAEAA